MNPMGCERPGDSHDLGQAAAHNGALPLAEQALSTSGIRLAPKIDYLLPVYSSAGCLQGHLQQLAKAGPNRSCIVPCRSR